MTAAKDSDGDGMSDAWEKEHGLDPNNAKDGAIVSLSGDDYTNLEMYLNELAGDTVDYNGKVLREPFSGRLINADILDTAYYDGWRIDSSLAVGDAVFGDRTAEKCAVSEMPVMPENTEILLTPCDAKASSSEQAEVTAAKDITLIVGFDSRMEKSRHGSAAGTRKTA